jgi:hypothetical protein
MRAEGTVSAGQDTARGWVCNLGGTAVVVVTAAALGCSASLLLQPSTAEGSTCVHHLHNLANTPCTDHLLVLCALHSVGCHPDVGTSLP